MNDDFKAIERRTVRYLYEDGLTEIFLGAVFLLLGAYFYGLGVLPGKSPLRGFGSLLIVPLVFAFAFLFRRLMRWFRQRVTYPRAGYVSYKPANQPKRRLRAAITGALAGILFSSLFAAFPQVKNWLPAINGVLFAAGCLLLAHKTGLPRFQVLTVVSFASGLGIALMGLGEWRGTSLHYAVSGVAFLLSGLIALVLFLRRNRPAGEGADEL